MGNIFFTSDHHFGHTNIIKYCNRPFETVHEMNCAYINAWCSQVTEKDTVYHLGDLTFNNPERYLAKLPGKIKIVPGNHDAWARKHKFQNNLKSIEILPPIYALESGKRKNAPLIVLCHYPMYTWPHKHYGSWHLYGHSHKELHYTPLALHIGVDSNDGRLYSLDDVRQEMAKRDRMMQEAREKQAEYKEAKEKLRRHKQRLRDRANELYNYEEQKCQKTKS